MNELSRDFYKSLEQKKVLTANHNDTFDVNIIENVTGHKNNLKFIRKLYISPILEFIAFDSVDIVCGSPNSEENDKWDDDIGGWD